MNFLRDLLSILIILHLELYNGSFSQEVSFDFDEEGVKNVTKGEFPFVVLVKRWDTNKRWCTGSLIAPNAVLTSAHCLSVAGKTIVDPKNVSVVAGLYNHEEFENYDQQTGYAKKIIKPWDFFSNSTFTRDDISIVQLWQDFILTPYVQTISLPDINFQLDLNSEGTVVGWGSEEDLTLQKKPFHVVHRNNCADSDVYKISYYNLHYNAFCAEGNASFCSGDEGAPFLFKNSDGNWTLFGTAYRSYENCESSVPVVFTHVPRYAKWINIIVNEASGIKSPNWLFYILPVTCKFILEFIKK